MIIRYKYLSVIVSFLLNLNYILMNVKATIMHGIKPTIQTILFTSIPLLLQSATPILAFFTAILGMVYMFFKMHTQYYEWKTKRIERKKKDY